MAGPQRHLSQLLAGLGYTATERHRSAMLQWITGAEAMPTTELMADSLQLIQVIRLYVLPTDARPDGEEKTLMLM